MTAQPQLTQAGAEALTEMPEEGRLAPLYLMIRRSWYRCARLERAGVLEGRVVDQHPHLSSGYRRTPVSHQNSGD